jgi:hypothetical protein
MHIDRRYQIAKVAVAATRARRDRRVHFMHVAKCGGTTLRYVLERFGRSGEALIDELRWSDANAAVHMLTGALGPEGDPVGAANRPYMAVRVENGAEFVDVSTVYLRT